MFFTYIKNKYGNYLNIIRQKNFLTNEKTSFEIITGNNSIIFSAPHNVMQVRNLQIKPLDLGTGHLLLNIVNKTNSHGIIKTNCVCEIGVKDDDANFEENHPYKIALSNYIKQHNIKYLIDLHSMEKDRPEQIKLGINGGENIQHNETVLNTIKDIFYNNGFLVSIDMPFNAGEGTISNYIEKTNNIFALQIEINSKLIHLKDPRNQFYKITTTLQEITTYLNSL